MKKSGKIITLIGSKGGVGLTNTVINLANIYAKDSKKVLIIDTNLTSGGLGVLLNRKPNRDIYYLTHDIVCNKFNTISEYTTTYNSNISFISAPVDIRNASLTDLESLIPLMNKLTLLYDIILIDTSHGLSSDNVLFADISDTVLVVTTSDVVALKNTRNIVASFKLANFKKYYILLNEAIYNNIFSLLEIKNIIGTHVDYTIPKCSFNNNLSKDILKGKFDFKCPKKELIHLNRLINRMDKEDL